jgi:asparagine synthase (glutamine-hydrolysing)
MCGIGGILRPAGGRPVERERLEALRDAQSHRGPDDRGAWLSSDGTIGLAHRRLSIIDLSPLGHQPMASADGRFQIVFNGEIYNYRELKRELAALGQPFRTESDTEVLIAGYAEWGEGLLDRLRGMFAFAIYDTRDDSVLLARDPLGIKPLYFARERGGLTFASEVDAIRSILPSPRVDAAAVSDFLLWGSIPPPRTLFEEIRSLPPGHLIRWKKDGAWDLHAYWKLESEFGQTLRMDEGEAAERARAALVDSVAHHAIADVPVGAFLSGGVDSASLVGLLGEVTSTAVRSVNLCFDDPNLDESSLAAFAAETYGADHLAVPIRMEELRERLPDAIGALDQPSIDGVNTFFVAEACVKAGLKVAVSGVGGDELFGGYLTFDRIPRIRTLRSRMGLVPGLSGALSGLEPALPWMTRGQVAPKLLRALVYGGSDEGAYFVERGLFSPPEVEQLLAPELRSVVDRARPDESVRSRVDLREVPAEERISAMEIAHYLQSQLLRDTDAVSMRHSLEVRTPLVDIGLLRDLMKIPAPSRRAGPAKKLLRQSPSPPVPDALWNRRKQGFTLPFATWIRDEAIGGRPIQSDFLAPASVEAIRTKVLAGKMHWSRLWALVVLDRFTR